MLSMIWRVMRIPGRDVLYVPVIALSCGYSNLPLSGVGRSLFAPGYYLSGFWHSMPQKLWIYTQNLLPRHLCDDTVKSNWKSAQRDRGSNKLACLASL